VRIAMFAIIFSCCSSGGFFTSVRYAFFSSGFSSSFFKTPLWMALGALLLLHVLQDDRA